MLKSEFVRRVSKQTRLPQYVVLDVLDASHRLIEETLRADDAVQLPGFGTFYARTRKEGTVKHIRTGEDVTVEARRVAGFRVGDILKRAVAGKGRRVEKRKKNKGNDRVF